MARTTRNPLHVIYTTNPEAKQTKQVRGQAPPKGIIMKAGMRVGHMEVGWSKSPRARQWKKLAKRRASKRTRQEQVDPGSL
jgi:hypothetical protein